MRELQCVVEVVERIVLVEVEQWMLFLVRDLSSSSRVVDKNPFSNSNFQLEL